MSRSANARVMLTVDEFLAYDLPDGKAELVRGELRVSPPPGSRHSAVITAILSRIATYVRTNRLGIVFTNGGFELLELPRTVRAPDVAFVRADRLPPEGVGPGLLRLAPDLAVEVISPTETRARVREKLEDYRTSRIPLVWLIDPQTRTVTVIEREQPSRDLGASDLLEGGDVIPGFSCAIAELFEGVV
jgi:Uma2 family endonuclease